MGRLSAPLHSGEVQDISGVEDRVIFSQSTCHQEEVVMRAAGESLPVGMGGSTCFH